MQNFYREFTYREEEDITNVEVPSAMSAREMTNWQNSPMSFIKCNADIRFKDGLVAPGVIARNHHCEVIRAWGKLLYANLA